MALRLTEEEYQALIKRRAHPKRIPAGIHQGGRRSELEFAQQLDAQVIPYQREFVFLPDRKFRFDFVLLPMCLRLAVEIDGQVHRIEKRFRSDREKGNLALANGWRVLHFAREQIRSGEAIFLTQEALVAPAIRS